jgi:hypothetical protein
MWSRCHIQLFAPVVPVDVYYAFAVAMTQIEANVLAFDPCIRVRLCGITCSIARWCGAEAHHVSWRVIHVTEILNVASRHARPLTLPFRNRAFVTVLLRPWVWKSIKHIGGPASRLRH